MNKLDTSVGIDGLIRPTATMVELSLGTSNTQQRHIEYLPYPDLNFLDDLSEGTEDEKWPLDHVYNHRNQSFVVGVPVEVIKIRGERVYNAVTEFLYPYLYIITTRHGSSCEWTINKRYKHFHDLHKALVEYIENRTGRSIGSLNKRSDVTDDKTNADETSSLMGKKDERPGFPTRNDRIAFVNQFTIEERCKTLQDYLNKILKHPKFRQHPAVKEFFEVSSLSFVEGLGNSSKEGAIAKRSNDDFRGRSVFLRVPFLCDKCKIHHGQKWFILKDTYLVYINPETSLVGFPMLVDNAFFLEQGFRKTGTNNGIRIKNLQRSMIIKSEHEEERDQWFAALSKLRETCLYAHQHPFNSYAPKRQNQYAQWFVNGQSYMAAVSRAIMAAKEEIFITDWWLSPELQLVRPDPDDSMRLDNLLGRRAEEGIRIYVMVFKDIVSVVGLNSLHSKVKLMSKSPNKKNIKVIRHPDHNVMPGTESSFLFSHHEKILVIDQRIAFIGGIDLCWGRWDTDEHKILDLGDENITQLKSAEELAYQDIEAEQADETAAATATSSGQNAVDNPSSSSVKTSKDLINSTKSNPEEKQSLVNTKANQDNGNEAGGSSRGFTDFSKELNDVEKKILADEQQTDVRVRHYRKKWKNIAKKVRHNDDQYASDDEEGIPYEEISEPKPKPAVDNKVRYFLGKDYSNAYDQDMREPEKFDEEYIDRKKVPRMPWHDEALVVTGEAARDCARHFIQRWNVHKADKFRFNESYPYILPKSFSDDKLHDRTVLSEILGDKKKLICVDAQCVRSVCYWSCGIRTVEHSIQNAYIHMIESAQNFIYIENQFFISIANDTTLKNNIADALYRRINRAHINKEKFRVYVVIPLIPGFANVFAVQAVLYFIMRSINKGETSLYERLRKSGISSPEDYISFYGMRNWDILMGELVTEVVYVHSKLMIVDDRTCICGSANINDRSLQGSRDSEFCLVINDNEMIDSRLNGQTQKVGVFCSTWRKKLFRQLLGIKDEKDTTVDDPCADEFYDYFRETAKKNAQIYEEVFKTLPANRVRTFAETSEYSTEPKLQRTDPVAAYEKCKQIKGFVVEFPTEFLADDVLLPKWNTSEGMAPILLWT